MKEMYLSLKNDIQNDVGWIKRFLSYIFDWYIGGVVASLPVILIYMSLHKDATYIPQNLTIFDFPYNIIAGILSFIVAVCYYVLVPMYVWKGQTLGKKIFKLCIYQNNFEEVTKKQIFIRQFVVILLVEGSLFTSSHMLHQLIEISTGIEMTKIYSYIGIVITVLSILCMILLKSRRAIHDLIAGTRVVKLNSKNVQYEIKKQAKRKKKSDA